MSKEIRIPYEKIKDSQTITPVMESEFKKNDIDIHRHEVTELTDDDKKQERVLKVKNTKYYTVPTLPWKK